MKQIKRFMLCLLLSVFTLTAMFASNGFEVYFEQTSSTEFELNYLLDDYRISETIKNGVTYSQIAFEGKVVTKEKGYAELPFIHASVQLSDDRNVSLEITSTDYVDYRLDYPLLPSRGTIYRNQDPSQIPYEIASESIVDEFYPGDIAEATEPFILRDIRGTNVYVYPFQYNAASNILRVYTDVTVKLSEDNTSAINPFPSQTRKILREMDSMYRTIFINYDVSRFDHEIGDFGSILVIRTARDVDAIAPYIQWKMEKGYTVYEEEVATGTNVTSLVSTQYNANNDILYVQLVGDWADVQGTTNSYGAPTDPNLGCVVGGDVYPDLIVGRFCANNTTHVTTQVNKTITYERDPEIGGTWYEAATGVASSQGPGDDGEYDNVHIQNIYDNKLDPFTYDAHTPIYDPSANATMVANALNAGTSIINYCGHGSMTSWGSSGFSNSHISSLTNGDMLPFIISVACNNGEFQSGECFAEAWLHKENGGAIGMYASTISQSWDPPMRGQDYINDLLIGGYDYSLYPGQNGITTDVQKQTFGSACFNGSILMTVEEYSGGQQEMEAWTVFGDAALDMRTASPSDLVLSNEVILMGIDFTTTVTTSGVPVEGALVCLSQDGNYFSGLTDEFGNVTISHTLIAGDAKMVVTAFNSDTIYDDITVIPPGGCYVLFNDYIIDDSAGNNNGIVEHSEQISFLVGLKNVGSEEATNIDATISSTNQYVTIINNFSNYNNVLPDSIEYGLTTFQIQIEPFCPDNEQLVFHLVINSSSDAWEYDFSIISYAPILELANFVIEDGNGDGRLEPGESGSLQINLINNGEGLAENITGLLYSDDVFITFDNNSSQISSLATGEVSGFDDMFTFTVSADCPAIHNLRLNLLLNEQLGYYNILQLDMSVGFYDNVEYGVNGWTHSALNGGQDQWHQSMLRYYSDMHSWKIGSTGTGSYYNSLLCALETPDIELTGDTYLTFYHWMSAETSSSYPGYCYDGGLVEIFHNSQWSQIVPEGGYPFLTRGDNSPPFAAETQVFSGSIDWERAFFNLEDYDGTVQFRFIFGSDGATAEEGWYIDDIAIVEPNVFLEPPANLYAENINAGEIELNWEQPSTLPLSYNIYKRNNLNNSYDLLTNTSEIFYLDTGLSYGIYYYVVTAVYEEGESSFSNPAQAYSGSVSSDENIVQSVCKVELMNNYPNPFNPETTIQFTTENTENTEIIIFNIKGQKVKTLINKELDAGYHSVIWDGRDDNDLPVSSGIYFYKMKAGDFTSVRKMLLMK